MKIKQLKEAKEQCKHNNVEYKPFPVYEYQNFQNLKIVKDRIFLSGQCLKCGEKVSHVSTLIFYGDI